VEKHQPESKHRAPATDTYADWEPTPLAAAADGGIAPGTVGELSNVPAATPRNFVCLRGPCRHYWQIETFFGAGNPVGTWEELGLREPRQISRSCLVHPGTETEVTEDCVFGCNLWDPLSPREARKREKRREAHYRRFPGHRPAEDVATIATYLEEET
jgi:hypothetical protein